jgi:hypothetical protein
MRFHLPAVAGVSLALTATAAAPAAAAPAAIYGGHTAQHAPIALRVSADGRTLQQLLVHVHFACDDGESASWAGAASFTTFKPPTISLGENAFSPARVSRRGSFRATGLAMESYGDHFGAIRETIRGTVRRGVARGTYSATLDITDAGGAKAISCRTGTLRWEARSAPGRTYAGLTSSGRPVVAQRSRDGRRIDSLWMSWGAPCQKGGGFSIGEEFVRFPLSGGGRFGNPFSDDYKLDDGGTRTYAYELEGKVGASRASGTLRVLVTEKDAAGATTDSCDTTLQRWTARSTKGAPVKPRRSEIRRVGS